MIKYVWRLAAVVAALGYIPCSWADSYFDYADVISVKPITDIVTSSDPHEECKEETVTREGSKSYTGTALGAVVGGVVGNQFGHKDGKIAATIGGAALGAAIGNDASNRDGDSSTEVRRRCRVVDRDYEERRTVGYKVTYRYQGHTNVTRLGYDPGDRVRVRVQISPVER
jgi:uncharacterized protein YcfJ